ncbi:MAG: DUF3330 domain-containing protein [Chromatiales bacterium]|jgi:ribosomal protein L24E
MEKPDLPEEELEKIACEICLAEIPPGKDEYVETDDYVMHFCGIDCYTRWKQQKPPQD